jgi:hypothetical protein
MDHLKLIEIIHNHIDNDDVDKAVMACLRLSRNLKDYASIAIFLRELSSEKQQLADVFFSETQHLKEEIQEYLWKQSFEKWIKERTVDWDIHKRDEDKTVYCKGVGEIKHEIDQFEKMINDMKLPQGMTEYDTAYFTDQNSLRKAELRLQIRNNITVLERIKNRSLNYVIQVEKQLESQRSSNLFIHDIYNDVNNYFKARSEDVYKKLIKASQLSSADNTEDYSLLLTTIRRAIKAVADFLYPPVSDIVECSDGKERKLGEDQYLNRLCEYFNRNFAGSSANELLKSELDYVSKLNDISCKGVHADVSIVEARQGMVGLYMFLFNLISRIQERNS